MPFKLTVVEGEPPYRAVPVGYDPAIEDVAMPIARELDQSGLGEHSKVGAIIGPYTVSRATEVELVYFQIGYSTE